MKRKSDDVAKERKKEFLCYVVSAVLITAFNWWFA